MAAAMGVELLTEEQYRELQKLGNFDTKTSSWVKTPSAIRKLGGWRLDSGVQGKCQMDKKQMLRLLFALTLTASAYGQKRDSGVDLGARARQISRVEQKEVRSETGGFKLPVKCDSDGNIYLRPGGSRLGPLRKIDHDGKQAITVAAGTEVQWSRFGYFDVDARGAIHQLGYVSGVADPYILHFRPDGSYGSRTKLQAELGMIWSAHQIASFPSGGFLVAGSIRDQTNSRSSASRALTAVISSDGAIVKEVKLVDDERLQQMAEKGDKELVLPGLPETNLAIDFGSMETAEDGNVYFMRQISPAIIYAISPVVRFSDDLR